MSDPPVAIRPAESTDLGFIIDTWRRSHGGPSSPLWSFDRDVYFHLMSRHIKALMREPDAMSLVACAPDDPDTVVGWSVITGGTLHYVYVREALRKHGVARKLLAPHELDTYAMRTAVGLGRLKPDARGMKYGPRTASWVNGKITVEMS